MFTIDSENTILACASQEEAQAVEGASIFASEKDLAKLAATWPVSRLVEIWNSFAGAVLFDELKPVRKFTDRKTAVARIWSALQRLNATVAPQVAHVAPKAAASAKETTAKKKAAKPPKAAKKAKAAMAAATREGSKKATVLEMIRRPNGATLKQIAAATSWQAHSVRGFISGALGKKMGLTVESLKTAEGARAYRIKPQ